MLPNVEYITDWKEGAALAAAAAAWTIYARNGHAYGRADQAEGYGRSGFGVR